MPSDKLWTLYLLRNERGALYTGITTDLERRFRQHTGEIARGAKFTRACSSLEIVYQAEIGDRSLASKVEARVKGLSKGDKENLVCRQPDTEDLLVELDLQPPDPPSPR